MRVTRATLSAEERRFLFEELLAVTSTLIAEFSGRLPAGTVIKSVARARENLLRAGVRAGLPVAAEAMARDRLQALRPARENLMNTDTRAPADLPSPPSVEAGSERRAVPGSLPTAPPAAVLDELHDSSTGGIVIVDTSAQKLPVDSRLEEMFGYRRVELPGHPVEQLPPAARRALSVAQRYSDAAAPPFRMMGGGALVGQRQPAVARHQSGTAEDLADTAVRGLLDIGLRLHAVLDLVPDARLPGLVRAIGSIDATIKDVQRAAFDLRCPPRTET